MKYLVTEAELEILLLLKNNYRSYNEVCKALNRQPSGVVSSIKHLHKFGLLLKDRLKYMAVDKEFEVANRGRVKRQRVKLLDESNILQDDNFYKPTQIEIEQIRDMIQKKLPRTEIAKRLNMTKTSLLFSLIQMRSDAENKKENIVEVERIHQDVFKLISKSDYTVMQIARELKREIGDIREAIMYLESIEAIKIKKNHNILNYIPLNKTLVLKNKKK